MVTPGAEHVAVGALGGRTGAYLTLSDAASRVRVVLTTLPGLLYRISTPAGSGLAPRVSGRDGRVQAALLPTGGNGPDEVRIVLNRDVRWHIRLPAGAGEQQLDLRRGRVTGLGLGASGLIEMQLPRPAGTVPVVLESAAGSVVVTAPPAAPVRVQLTEGAGSATVPWQPPGPAPAGAVLQSPAFPAALDRYTIRAEQGVGALIVRR
ncbi:hypothetical protein Ari01nite_02160 [Paractinoplanes rishiriensis]|uniref:Uncharacterized protein n=1 Tax=Paractinoplanes rishiriensis TaxID=1050105 RepID=A0A919MMA2_9ACTN|nr:hypothetical protein Ari01nite_02160 [Actinoplanes rishiriensis]